MIGVVDVDRRTTTILEAYYFHIDEFEGVDMRCGAQNNSKSVHTVKYFQPMKFIKANVITLI